MNMKGHYIVIVTSKLQSIFQVLSPFMLILIFTEITKIIMAFIFLSPESVSQPPYPSWYIFLQADEKINLHPFGIEIRFFVFHICIFHA